MKKRFIPQEDRKKEIFLRLLLFAEKDPADSLPDAAGPAAQTPRPCHRPEPSCLTESIREKRAEAVNFAKPSPTVKLPVKNMKEIRNKAAKKLAFPT